MVLFWIADLYLRAQIIRYVEILQEKAKGRKKAKRRVIL
jgi:hypothetical protein